MTDEKLLTFIRDMVAQSLELTGELEVKCYDEGTLFPTRKLVIHNKKTGTEEVFKIKVQKIS